MSDHLVLLGDSIFDNASYVPGGPSVIEHVRRLLPVDRQATLLAVDGAVVGSVFTQLERMPEDATHLVLSVGGNNALWTAGNLLPMPAGSVRDALQHIATVLDDFSREYRRLINELRQRRRPITVCTIYDTIPGLSDIERAGLCVFNDVITRTAFAAGLTLIDLRTICREASDYAAISPIEPSAAGGGKIARAIVSAVLGDEPTSRVIA